MRLLRFPTLLILLALLCVSCPSGGMESEVGQAREAFKQARYLEAEKLYERYLQLYPRGADRWEAWSRLLDVSLNVRGDREKAADLLEAMHLEFGDAPERSWDLLSRLAEVYESMRRWDQASDVWQRCLNIPRLDPSYYPQVHRRLGRIYLAQRQFDLAQESLEVCVADARQDSLKALCLYELAQAYGYMQNLPRATEPLRRILAMPGADKETKALAAFLLADILEQQGHWADSENLLLSILDTYPNRMAVETRLKHIRTSRNETGS